MYHMAQNPAAGISTIALTPYSAKANAVTRYSLPAQLTNLKTAMRNMSSYIDFVFEGTCFEGLSQTEIDNIKSEIISRIDNNTKTGLFIPYRHNELIDKTVHNIKAIQGVANQLQTLNFAQKQEMQNACDNVTAKYQTWANVFKAYKRQ